MHSSSKNFKTKSYYIDGEYIEKQRVKWNDAV